MIHARKTPIHQNILELEYKRLELDENFIELQQNIFELQYKRLELDENFIELHQNIFELQYKRLDAYPKTHDIVPKSLATQETSLGQKPRNFEVGIKHVLQDENTTNPMALKCDEVGIGDTLHVQRVDKKNCQVSDLAVALHKNGDCYAAVFLLVKLLLDF